MYSYQERKVCRGSNTGSMVSPTVRISAAQYGFTNEPRVRISAAGNLNNSINGCYGGYLSWSSPFCSGVVLWSSPLRIVW